MSGSDSSLREEDDHERRMAELHNKVSALKDVTIQIGEHARQDNRELDTLSTGFSGLDVMLNSTIGKIKQLSDAGGGYTLYTVLFALAVFFVLYLILR